MMNKHSLPGHGVPTLRECSLRMKRFCNDDDWLREVIEDAKSLLKSGQDHDGGGIMGDKHLAVSSAIMKNFEENICVDHNVMEKAELQILSAVVIFTDSSLSGHDKFTTEHTSSVYFSEECCKALVVLSRHDALSLIFDKADAFGFYSMCRVAFETLLPDAAEIVYRSWTGETKGIPKAAKDVLLDFLDYKLLTVSEDEYWTPVSVEAPQAFKKWNEVVLEKFSWIDGNLRLLPNSPALEGEPQPKKRVRV